MTLVIEISPEREEILRRAAARRGVAATDLARDLLDEQLDEEDRFCETGAPANGAELVAFWQAEGVVGAWAGRTDITDSPSYARDLRQRVEARTAE